MSLLFTDITQRKKLSLRDVKLPASEPKIEPFTYIHVKRPPSDEEVAYSKFVAKNSLIEELVKRLDLVSITTGERIKKVELREEYKAQDIDKSKLIILVNKIMKPETSYTKEELIARIKEATNVNQERAERGFSLFLQNGSIEPTLGDTFFLTGSTPF
jgi:hypothetical protein